MHLTERDLERFWGLVNKAGPRPSEALGPCWIWQGDHHFDGSGAITIGGQVDARPHLIAFFIATGRWPKRPVSRHCENLDCVCPEHLIEGERTTLPKQRLFRVPIYPQSRAEVDLERVRGMHPAVPTAKITQRALEIGLGRLAGLEEDLVPANDNGGAR